MQLFKIMQVKQIIVIHQRRKKTPDPSQQTCSGKSHPALRLSYQSGLSEFCAPAAPIATIDVLSKHQPVRYNTGHGHTVCRRIAAIGRDDLSSVRRLMNISLIGAMATKNTNDMDQRLLLSLCVQIILLSSRRPSKNNA